MNGRTDIEHVLTTWFDDGPTAMPDRVAVVVADRIAREPQRQPWRLPPWRQPSMNATLKIAAAIAAVLVIAVLGSRLLLSSPSGAGGSSATPSASATDLPQSPGPSLGTYSWPGPLTAGTYRTSLVWDVPFAFEFTVPDGWEAFDIEISKPGSHGLSVEFVLVDNVYADPCNGVQHDPPVGPTVDDLAEAVRLVPGLDVAAAAPFALDRSTNGTTVGYVVREDAGCAPSAFQLWALPVNRTLPGKHFGGAGKTAVAREGRIWILDVDGTRVVIRTTWDPDTTQAERNELQAIVDSVRIARPGETPPPQPAAP
jgi:hypothetical protein